MTVTFFKPELFLHMNCKVSMLVNCRKKMFNIKVKKSSKRIGVMDAMVPSP